jgi:hypothetical protein
VRLADLGAVRPIEEVLRSLGPAAPPLRPGRLAPAAVAPPAEKKSPAAAEPAAAGDPTAVFRARLRDARPMIAALLDKAGSLEWAEDGALRIVVAHASEAVGRQIASPETVRLLEGAAAEAVGRPVRVRVEIEAATRAATEPAGAAAAHRRPAERQAPRTAALDAARAEAGVSNLLREFGADVVDFRALDPIADAGGDPSEDGG